MTEKIGLRNFLFNARVPDVPSPACRWCAAPHETAKHIIVVCSRFYEERHELRAANGTLDLRFLLETAEGAHVLTRW